MTGWNCQAGGRPLQGPSPILCEQPDGTALPQPDRPVTNVMPCNNQTPPPAVLPRQGGRRGLVFREVDPHHHPADCGAADLLEPGIPEDLPGTYVHFAPGDLL